ncbi:unnamed protein product [Notodromas monacha]|uniref:tRNA pseudouridine(55) synthase n=1 Tax=Notodromas monacha TaxID=399045 RepID=A0A7R9GD41_9CRUS|nr:unnamed protein product [Notodromas monacha]CAG0918144.1 unnamed protein product [Notodromas monacha]
MIAESICEPCRRRCFLKSEVIGNDDPVIKKPRLSSCTLCLGILNETVLDEVINVAFRALESIGYEYTSLCFNLTTPVAILVREASFKIANSGKALPDLKETWKNILQSRLDAAGRTCNLVRNADEDDTVVSVNVKYTYVDDKKECEKVRSLDPSFAANHKKVHGVKYDERVLTRLYVQSVLDNASSSSIEKVFPYPMGYESEAVLGSVETSRCSYWLAGRYIKRSRTLPQTPWVIDGVRKGETSLEEIIRDGILSCVPCDSVRFSSSGREDVDVRCLGSGRPFLCQIINPKKLGKDKMTALAVKNAVNSSSNDIQIRDVQFVSKAEAGNLKEGEEEKIKCYEAFCVSQEEILPEKLDKLQEHSGLTITQKTPIRVLHRRSLADRERVVHKLQASPCPGRDARFFILKLDTQAGTYVKEFVHGDLGRTSPNLSQILGVATDIVALDVVAVLFDWPPCLQD